MNTNPSHTVEPDLADSEESWKFLDGTMYLPPSEPLAKAIREQHEAAIRLLLEGVTIEPYPRSNQADYSMNISTGHDVLSDFNLHETQSLRQMMLNTARQSIATAINDGESPANCRSRAAEILRSIADEIESLALHDQP